MRAARTTSRDRCATIPRRRARLIAALSVATIAASIGIAAGNASAATYPVEASYTGAGPFSTTSATVKDGSGTVIYDLYYPSNYSGLRFKSPVITWGNGTNATPDMYSTLLSHFASYGFTVIASTLKNTGSGNEIDAAAHYLVTQNSTAGSPFNGNLDVNEVAAVGHSQGAGGATRAATNDPTLIKALLTFSLPNTFWVGSNPDCPTAADCMYNPALLTQPAFFVSTHGTLDSFIASPSTETAFYNSVKGHAALGIIKQSDGKAADHNSVQNTANGGNPGGELGYATAWVEYQLRGDSTAAGAFTGGHPELVTNTNWPGSAAK
jgi:pimeloyl-ACP methyl ester carboxylesterase